MNIFIYRYVYFVPIVHFISKKNRDGGGLPHKDYPLFMRVIIYKSTKRIDNPLINEVKRERGNPPPFRPYIVNTKTYHTKFSHRSDYIKKNGPPPYLLKQTGMIGFVFLYFILLRHILVPRNFEFCILNFAFKECILLQPLPQASYE